MGKPLTFAWKLLKFPGIVLNVCWMIECPPPNVSSVVKTGEYTFSVNRRLLPIRSQICTRLLWCLAAPTAGALHFGVWLQFSLSKSDCNASGLPWSRPRSEIATYHWSFTELESTFPDLSISQVRIAAGRCCFLLIRSSSRSSGRVQLMLWKGGGGLLACGLLDRLAGPLYAMFLSPEWPRTCLKVLEALNVWFVSSGRRVLCSFKKRFAPSGG